MRTHRLRQLLSLKGKDTLSDSLTTLRQRQHGRHFADDIFKRIFLNENVLISINISLKFIPKGPLDNMSALVQIMAWWWKGSSHYLNQWWLNLMMHIRVTQPQWVTSLAPGLSGIFSWLTISELWTLLWKILIKSDRWLPNSMISMPVPLMQIQPSQWTGLNQLKLEKGK